MKRRMAWQRGEGYDKEENKRTEKRMVWQRGWWNDKGAGRGEETDCKRQLTSWARITISPVCRISVDFPPMFGPVTMTTRLPACSSPISLEFWLHASIRTCTHTGTQRSTQTHTTNKNATKMKQPTVSFSLDNSSWECPWLLYSHRDVIEVS